MLRAAPVDDQLGHGLAGRGRVEDSPDAVAGGDVSARDAGTAPISGRPSCVTGRKQDCRATIRSARNAGDSRSAMACRRSIARGSV